MEEILEEEEEEEEEDCEDIYFSNDDLLQIRNSVFLLLKNFLRLLPKFSLKEKPQCVQNCLQVIKFNSRKLLSSDTNWWCSLSSDPQADQHILPSRELAKLGFVSPQVFVEMTSFEPAVHELEFSSAMWASHSQCLYAALSTSKALSACVVFNLLIRKWKQWFILWKIIRTCST